MKQAVFAVATLYYTTGDYNIGLGFFNILVKPRTYCKFCRLSLGRLYANDTSFQQSESISVGCELANHLPSKFKILDRIENNPV